MGEKMSKEEAEEYITLLRQVKALCDDCVRLDVSPLKLKQLVNESVDVD
jgi:hypothetical protein